MKNKIFLHASLDSPPEGCYNTNIMMVELDTNQLPEALLQATEPPKSAPPLAREGELPAGAPPPLDKERLLKVGVLKVQLLRLAMKGLNATEAAKVLSISTQTAREYYRDPSFRAEVLRKVDVAFEGVDLAFADKRKNLHEMLEEQAYKSCNDLIMMLEDPDLHPTLRVKINQDFLNRHEDSKPLAGHSYKIAPGELRHAASVAAEMDNVIPIKRGA